ncbi:MAG: amidohydrolase family protein [Gammaproteobacteria bacterium]|nr:amidohydrolase family protein [Gammaproteobacteria bacterium]
MLYEYLCCSKLAMTCVLAVIVYGYGLSDIHASGMNGEDVACFDRASQPVTAVVDTHVHFRPFGGPPLPFGEVIEYLERTGVRFVNAYGIGQMLPVTSGCTYYLDCIGTPVTPTLKNDFANAMSYLAEGTGSVRVTLSMTFPDLARPETVLAGMRLLDREFPGLFKWMGEVNLVKQALSGNGREPVPLEKIRGWAQFMAELRSRDMPIAIHSDLGNDEEPTRYLAWIQELLQRYPDNRIIWMHLGLSRELADISPDAHITILKSLLDQYPKFMVDISWRVLEDNIFSDPAKRAYYVSFLNVYSDRVLPGTDFVASSNKNFDVYKEELEATSRIIGYLDDTAFRNIALGENYFRLLNLDEQAPLVCSQD